MSVGEAPLRRYRAHGLTLASPLPCPELAPSAGDPDVIVRFGAVPDDLDAPLARTLSCQFRPEQCLLDVRTIAGARFLVQNGNEIIVECTDGASANVIRLFLFGSCMAALLVQRGLLPIHASAIATPRGAVLFAGPSTAGKSTLAAAFLRRGYPILADDISAVRVTAEGRPLVAPELNRLKLWAHTLRHLAVDARTLGRLRPELEKYGYPLGAGFAPQPAVLHTLYLLHPHDRPLIEIAPVDGLAKFARLRGALYRGEHLPWAQFRAEWFRRLAGVAERIDVRTLRFPHDFSRLPELADRLERDFQDAGRTVHDGR